MTPFKNTKEEFLARFTLLLHEVKDLTPGAEAEQWLNTQYGVESELYQDLARLIRLGVQEGWAADTEIAGPRYRRSQLAAPSAETFFFGITIVLMDSTDNTQNNPQDSFRGNYHSHPYGEFNLAIPLTEGAALAGPNGWRYGGWTVPAAGSHHHPEAKGGAMVSVSFLPAGRIAFDVKPPQP